MDFDTTSDGKNNNRKLRPPGPSSSRNPDHRHPFATGANRNPSPEAGTFQIPAGSRKGALVHLGLAAWHAGLLDPQEVGG